GAAGRARADLPGSAQDRGAHAPCHRDALCDRRGAARPWRASGNVPAGGARARAAMAHMAVAPDASAALASMGGDAVKKQNMPAASIDEADIDELMRAAGADPSDSA